MILTFFKSRSLLSNSKTCENDLLLIQFIAMRKIYHIIVGILFTYPILLFAQPKPSAIPTEKQFIVQSAMNFGLDSSGFWDIQSNYKFFRKCIYLQVWDLDPARGQKISLVNSPEFGYYEICVDSIKESRVTVDTIKNEANIETKDKNDGANQRFLFHHLDNGRFVIYSRNSLVVCLTDCSSKDGSKIHLLDKPNGKCSEWFLIDPQTKKIYIPSETSPKLRTISNNSTVITPESNEIYRLITNGIENDIKKYFKEVDLAELIRSDNGSILKAFNKLNPNDKVTHTIWVLEEIKNRTPEIKRYVYSELEKVDYSKPSFILKQLINNYFTNFNEMDDSLMEKVVNLQKKMNK